MIEILIVRNPDSANDVQVFRDGVDVTNDNDVYIVEVDPGAGWTYEDWQESAKAAFEGGTWPKFRTAVMDAYCDPPGKQYIDNWPEEDR